jgi:imidazolonepropionase-like amidohydrolase
MVPEGTRGRCEDGAWIRHSPLKDAALLELGLWVRDGATPWQALIAATRNGAAVCGMENELGTIEVGKLADLIVVDGNPLDDIDNFRNLRWSSRKA